MVKFAAGEENLRVSLIIDLIPLRSAGCFKEWASGIQSFG